MDNTGNDKIKSLQQAISDIDKLISENEMRQKGLKVEAKALELADSEAREEVKILRRYAEILKENPLQDEEVVSEYNSCIVALNNQLANISQIGIHMNQLHRELSDLKRYKSRSDSIKVGYQQQIQNIEYVRSANGKDFLIQRVAMSISETLFREELSGENKLKKFVKNIFNK